MLTSGLFFPLEKSVRLSGFKIFLECLKILEIQ